MTSFVGNSTPGGDIVTTNGTSITINGVTTQIPVGSTVTTNGTSITIDGVTTQIPVGLDQTAVDARVDALVHKAALAANEGKAVRVDNGAVEYPHIWITRVDTSGAAPTDLSTAWLIDSTDGQLSTTAGSDLYLYPVDRAISVVPDFN